MYSTNGYLLTWLHLSAIIQFEQCLFLSFLYNQYTHKILHIQRPNSQNKPPNIRNLKLFKQQLSGKFIHLQVVRIRKPVINKFKYTIIFYKLHTSTAYLNNYVRALTAWSIHTLPRLAVCGKATVPGYCNDVRNESLRILEFSCNTTITSVN